jgi:hypothetical protein
LSITLEIRFPLPRARSLLPFVDAGQASANRFVMERTTQWALSETIWLQWNHRHPLFPKSRNPEVNEFPVMVSCHARFFCFWSYDPFQFERDRPPDMPHFRIIIGGIFSALYPHLTSLTLKFTKT